MPSYNYIAVNELGRRSRGVIMADNEIDLESRLKEIGLDLMHSREVREKKAGFGSNVRLKDLIILCLHMEQLIRAGVALHEALADVRDSTESLKLRDIMTDVTESVKGGTMLSDALQKYPRVFNNVFVGLVAAGERTGNLSESFTHMSEHMKWTSDMRRKVRKAVTYPIVLLVLMSIVIAILMTQVVPKLKEFILGQGFELPPHTIALIWVSEQFEAYWYAIFGVPILIGIALIVLYRSIEGFAYKVDGFMLAIPSVGSTIRKINLARFTHFFAVMFKSGIDILDALEGANGVVANRVLRESIDMLQRSVEGGESLTNSLRISNEFPTLVVRMFKVGEDSGNMNDALENVNFFYNREVNDAVDAMIGSIQPMLTIVMGGLIFWVIAAVFGPLYQSFEKMNF